MTTTYRTRIYSRYASGFQQSGSQLDREAHERWGRAFDFYLRDWLPQDKSAPIGDLGCGDGKLLHFFQKRGYGCVSGVDISAEQVALARQVTPNVELGSAHDFLEKHRDHFSLLTGLDIAEHLHKDEVMALLDGCYRALAPGGRLVLQTPNGESPWCGAIRYGDFTHEVCFSPNLLTRLLSMSGFRSTEAREQGPVPLLYSFKSTARYMVWQTIRCGLKLWNAAETGSAGSGVFTRVFLVSAIK